jgi:high-affinity K+ transport system ATPase subunit B
MGWGRFFRGNRGWHRVCSFWVMRNAAFESSDGFKNSEPPGKPTQLFTSAKIWPALKQTVKMLRPGIQRKNPAMFLAEIGAILTSAGIAYTALFAAGGKTSLPYLISLDLWLFLTVLCTNFVAALTDAPSASRKSPPRPLKAANFIG